MSKYEEIVALAGDELVGLSKEFEAEWGKKLRLGHTDWVIQKDLLGEGHGHFIPASAYFQSVLELFSRSNAISEREAQAMEAQADLLDAKDKLDKAETDSEKLRAKAKLKRAEAQLGSLLIQIKDVRREMQVLHDMMKRLEPEVKAKYGCDIEKAQYDIWLSRYRYAAAKGDRLDNKPLPLDDKLKIGMSKGRDRDVMALADAQVGYERDWEERLKKVETKKSDDTLLSNSERKEVRNPEPNCS